MKIRKGTTLILETGAYSDYSFTGPFRVMRDFDQASVLATFRAQWTPASDYPDEQPDPRDFIGWLSREGFIEDIEGAVRWALGDYGRLSPDIHPKPE